MKIEKGIPIPPPRSGMGRPVSPLGKTISALEIGDSFMVETEDEANKARNMGHHRGMKVIRRKTGDGWRIWRTE